MIIQHEIFIDASPELVWDVTEDVERWPEWTRTMTSVKSLEGTGLELGTSFRIKQPAKRRPFGSSRRLNGDVDSRGRPADLAYTWLRPMRSYP